MKNIKILGAGVSGLTAAINLAKAGYKVKVYEKNKDVGMRFQGDIQGLENWSEKKSILKQLNEMNIKINFDCDPFSYLTVTNCINTKKIHDKKPLYYLVKRGPIPGTLDCGLKEQALELGVKIYFEKTLKDHEADIIATGPILKEVPAIDKGILFKSNSKDKAVLLVSDELAFKGYSYLFITKGYGCICTVVLDKTSKINECFKKTKNYFIKKFKVNIQSPKVVVGIASFSSKHRFEERYKKKNILYVGEAAGLQDFLWGFGMRYAFESGHLAAQSIINGEDYEEIAKKRFRNKLKASMVNRFAWEILDKINYPFLIDNIDLAKRGFISHISILYYIKHYFL